MRTKTKLKYSTRCSIAGNPIAGVDEIGLMRGKDNGTGRVQGNMMVRERERRQQQQQRQNAQQQKQQQQQHQHRKDNEVPENLWETMLREAMRRSRLPDSTVVFVGPQGCGKSSLLDTFFEGSASINNPSGGAAAAAAAAVAPTTEAGPEGGAGVVGSGAADAGQQAATARGFHPVVAYSYLDATDPAEQGSERDDSPPRVSVWCCSEVEFEGLLQTVLRPSSLANTAVMVGVDLSRPWEVMDTLQKWIEVLERHVVELMKHISVGAGDDLRNAVRERLIAVARFGARGVAQGEDPGRDDHHDEDEVSAGLGEGILEKNLGVSIIVVGCKADTLQSETFEQQQRLHFIQQNLRRFCLKYGAALVYTSGKNGVNCGLLHRYLLSCLYPGTFLCNEDGQTTDAAFIPAGWDSTRLIEGLLLAEKTPWGPNAEFGDVVVPPHLVGRAGGGADGGGGIGGGITMAVGWGGDGDLGFGSEGPEETVESEEAWLARLEKQMAGGDPRARWKGAVETIRKKSGRAKSPRPSQSSMGDPRSFFQNLLASGSSVSPPKGGGPRKKT